MPDTFSKVLFEGEFDPNAIVKGVDSLTASLKLAGEQGTLTNEQYQELEGTITKLKATIADLQKSTGKTIAPALDNTKYIQEIDNLKAKIAEMQGVVTKTVDTSKAKVAELTATQRAYKQSISDINAALKLNQAEAEKAKNKLKELNSTGGGTVETFAAVNKEMRTVALTTKELQGGLAAAQKGLSDTNTQLNIQKTALAGAEKASSGFGGAIRGAFSSLRQLAFILPGIGIAGLINIIAGPLIAAFSAWIESINNVNGKAKILEDINKAAIKSYSAEVVSLDLIKDKLDDLSIPESKRIELAKQYNKTAEEGNRIDIAQINNIDLLNAAIDRQIAKIKERALAKAAENVITEKAEKLFEAQSNLELNFQDFSNKNINAIVSKADAAVNEAKKRLGITIKTSTKELLSFADFTPEDLAKIDLNADKLKILLDKRSGAILTNLQRELVAINQYRAGLKPGGAGVSIAQAAIDQAQKDLNDALDVAKGFISIDTLIKPKIEKQRKAIEDIYIQELQKLKADLAKLDEQGLTNEDTITAAVEADFKKRDLAFQRAFKNKQLTAPELASLQENLANLQKLTLDKSLKDFAAQKAAYLEKISNELATIQADENLKRISTIKDDFERERQTIIAESDKTITALNTSRDKQIAEIVKDAAKNGFTPASIKPQVDQIKDAYSKLIDDLGLIREQKLQKLGFDTFEKLSEDAKRLLDSGNLGISQGSLINIQAQTKLFAQGKISFDDYQKALTDIARAEANERFNIEKVFLQAEIDIRKAKLANDKDLTDDQRTKLEDEVRRLQQQLTDATKNNTITGATNTNKDAQARLADIREYAEAIGSVVESVISFWQQANEAEQKALDRSIAIQDRRVTAAQQVAAKGNAEYLRLEEERQQALLIKQENAARRQIAINAALQASQLLVAVTGAVAKIATPGVGAVDVISSIGVIVGALAAGYGLIKSLQNNQPSFYVGTEDTGPGGQVDSKGGFDATLHPHERVVSAEDNKHLRGISNKELVEVVRKSEVFVNNWRSTPAPALNIAAMDMANNVTGTANVKLAGIMEDNNKALKENNALQVETLHVLKHMGIEVNMDQYGLSLSIMKGIEKYKKSLKS